MKDKGDFGMDHELDTPDMLKKKKKKSHKHNRQKEEHQMNGDAEVKSAKKMKVRKTDKLNRSFVQVIATPDYLLPTPSIFKKSNHEQAVDFGFSNFVKSKINLESTSRFTNSLSLVDKIKNLTPEKPETKKLGETVVIDDDDIVAVPIENIQKSSPGKIPEPAPEVKSSPEIKAAPENKKKREANIQAYQVPHRNAFILFIQHPTEFSFYGKFKLTLLAGLLEINGYTLEPESSITLFSPKFCTAPVIETQIPASDLNIEELESILLNSNLITKSDMSKILNEIKPYDSVVLIEEVTVNFVKVFEKYSDWQLFTELPVGGSPLPEVAQSLHCVFNLTNGAKEFRKNPDWDKLSLGSCNFVCGGKNVGKSSLIKYLINKNLSQCGAVVCLDLDPGQPEFSPPGCLAVTVLRKPVIGPNFTQGVEPEKMVFFGEISVVQQPTTYLEAVKFLVDYYRQDPVLLRMPCFVNTMGFNKGLGVALTVSLIKLLRPDSLIQITSKDPKHNFPYHFTPECLKFAEANPFNISDSSDFIYDFNLIECYSEEEGQPYVGALKPRDLRDLKFLSYFSRMVTLENPNFNTVQPYSISFSKLYLAVHGAISHSDILKAFNGNLVALCQYKEDLSSEFLEPEDKDYFRILVKPSVMPCLGLGFVRGIDINTKKIFIITHLSSFHMESVNCLMLGFLTPPHSIYLKQDTVNGSIPYTSINSGDNVQMVKRAYRFPRHQHTP